MTELNIYSICNTRVAQIPDVMSVGRLNFVGLLLVFVGTLYRNASWHPYGPWNMEVAATFLEHLWTSV